MLLLLWRRSLWLFYGGCWSSLHDILKTGPLQRTMDVVYDEKLPWEEDELC